MSLLAGARWYPLQWQHKGHTNSCSAARPLRAVIITNEPRHTTPESCCVLLSATSQSPEAGHDGRRLRVQPFMTLLHVETQDLVLYNQSATALRSGRRLRQLLLMAYSYYCCCKGGTVNDELGLIESTLAMSSVALLRRCSAKQLSSRPCTAFIMYASACAMARADSPPCTRCGIPKSTLASSACRKCRDTAVRTLLHDTQGLKFQHAHRSQQQWSIGSQGKSEYLAMQKFAQQEMSCNATFARLLKVLVQLQHS